MAGFLPAQAVLENKGSLDNERPKQRSYLLCCLFGLQRSRAGRADFQKGSDPMLNPFLASLYANHSGTRFPEGPIFLALAIAGHD